MHCKLQVASCSVIYHTRFCSQLSTCYDHKECKGKGQGLKCVNQVSKQIQLELFQNLNLQVCGEAQYLEAIKEFGCKTDDYCKVRGWRAALQMAERAINS